MSLSEMRKLNLQLNPSNSTSTGDYSPSSGLPLIKFDISSTDMPTNLDLSQLRINGNITYFTGNQPGTPTQPGAASSSYRDCYSGDLSNVIDHVTISSKKLSSVIERVNNYSRMVPSIVTGNHGEHEINCQLWNQGGSCTSNFMARNIIRAQNGVRGVAGTANGYGKGFSMPLFCGLLNSDRDLDISVAGTGGLTIEILLKPNVSVAFGADAGAAATAVNYKVSNLLLTVPAYELSGQTAAAALSADRVFNFNSISSIFQTLNSSTSVVSITPGLSRVSSVFMNAINTNEIGNQLFNSARLSNMGALREVRFSRNGMLHPLQYRLSGDQQANSLTAALNGQTLAGRAMVDVSYLEGISTNPIGNTGRTMLAYNTINSGIKNRGQTVNSSGDDVGTVSGTAILFDAYGSGENFQQTTFSVDFNNQTIDGTQATTMGLYMYFLSQNTLVMSPQGLSVVK